LVNLTTIRDGGVTHSPLCAAYAESQGVTPTLEGATPLSSFMPDLAGPRDLSAPLDTPPDPRAGGGGAQRAPDDHPRPDLPHRHSRGAS
jgi:hypothetical protein